MLAGRAGVRVHHGVDTAPGVDSDSRRDANANRNTDGAPDETWTENRVKGN